MARTSIIIPAYNYGRYLAETVRSALAQDDGDVEVLIVNDGSTDDTAEVAQSFGEQVRYVYKTNGGLSDTRNTGIAAATGRYLVFLDADDILVPHAVSRMRTKLESLDAGFGVIACSHEEIDAGGKWIRDVIQAPPEGATAAAGDIVLSSRFCTTVMARAECFRDAGNFDVTLAASEDRDMWIRIAAAGWKIHILGEKLLGVRRHGANMSAAVDRQTTAMRTVIGRAWRNKTVPRWNLFFWAKVWAVYHYQTSSMCWNLGRKTAAKLHVIYSLLLWPWFTRSARLGRPVLFRVKRLASWLLKGR